MGVPGALALTAVVFAAFRAGRRNNGYPATEGRGCGAEAPPSRRVRELDHLPSPATPQRTRCIPPQYASFRAKGRGCVQQRHYSIMSSWIERVTADVACAFEPRGASLANTQTRTLNEWIRSWLEIIATLSLTQRDTRGQHGTARVPQNQGGTPTC